ncbi:MAG TPA: hypothetical protein VGC32_08920 [Solirubrobacterales bacterium]
MWGRDRCYCGCGRRIDKQQRLLNGQVRSLSNVRGELGELYLRCVPAIHDVPEFQALFIEGSERIDRFQRILHDEEIADEPPFDQAFYEATNAWFWEATVHKRRLERLLEEEDDPTMATLLSTYMGAKEDLRRDGTRRTDPFLAALSQGLTN